MREQKKNRSQERRERFEEIYIHTFQKTYDHIRLLIADEKKAKKLLILTYADVYSNMEDLFGKGNVTGWIQEKADGIAEMKMEISPEQIRSARMKENMKKNSILKSGNSAKEKKSLDETSVFLEIEDYLKLDENMDLNGESSKIWMIVKNVFAFGFLAAAVGAIVVGADKIKKQIDLIRAPFLEFMSREEDLLEAQKNQKKHIKIANKIVYLSEVGQVLYSIPLEQTEWASESPDNSEIQAGRGGWVYYLPCPEREDSVLTKVSPSLFHTLYRIKNGKEEIEIISQEVEDYCILEDKIYIESFDRIQVLESTDQYDIMVPKQYIEIENCEFYLRDMLGRTLDREEDGNIHYGDRILQMDSDRIADVVQMEQKKNNSVFELREQEDSNQVIYRITGDVEELFIKEGISIDSFCIVGDWLYYSTFIRRGGSGRNYSKIFRKSLVGDYSTEEVHREFTGRINQMYYCQDNDQIYGNYFPTNWMNHYGVIAVIEMNGDMSYLDDKEQRAMRETTGNDILEFIMMKDHQVYCYWKDFNWEKGKEPEILWRDVIVISDSNRVRMKN